MNASKSILLAGLFAIMTAEFSFAQNTPTPAATVEPDIKSFKELVTGFPTRSIIKSTKETYDIVDVTFDVKKTDSLMNPVIGIINFTARIPLPSKLQKDLTELKLVAEPTDFRMQMVFHWQDDRWTFERILNRDNGVDFTHNERWGTGPMWDFLKSVQ